MAILIVDDCEDSLEMLSLIMEGHGFAVTPAGSLAEARALPGPFSAVLTDWSLPDGAGAELLALGLPCALMTGHRGAPAAGFDRVFLKPLDERAVAAIAAWLRAAARP